MNSRWIPAGDRMARLLPPRSRLAFRYRLRRLCSGLEVEISQLERIAGRGRVAVDAGANEGWYALPLSGLFDRVLAFEPNEPLLDDLRSAGRPRIELFAQGLSNRDGSARLSVPVRDGLVLSGWGSLDPDRSAPWSGEVVREVSVGRLDGLELTELDFLKIDVEGHECELLEGARRTLRQCRPTVLVEIRPGNESRVDRILLDCGLSPVDPVHEALAITPGNRLYRPRHQPGANGAGGCDSPR